jgi:xylan 1,4-beta-xylosidase
MNSISRKTVAVVILFLMCLPAIACAQKSEITVSEPAVQKQLNMPWRNTIAVGRAHNLLRADILEHLAYAQNIMGYRYCRFHAIFDDALDVVRRDPKTNQLVFQWHQVDLVYDALLKLGIRPFVELNPMPKALASGTQTMFNYQMNVTPPKSYDEWGQLVEAFATHLVERYGIDEVRQWYFEVWNEPNLGAFWSGTQAEYFKLYESSARAIKKVDSKLRVGGPASSKANWIKEIITYTTKNNIPLDFVSTHLYAQDEQVQYPNRKGSPHKVGDFFSETVKEVTRWVKASERPDLEIHWTEWNTQSAKDSASVTWGENIYVDNLYGASFIVRNCLEVDNECKSFAYWVISDLFDEGNIPVSPFSCTYGLITIHGIPKAHFNGFRFLRKMEGDIMDVKTDKPLPNGKGCVVTRTKTSTRVLMWNQNFVEDTKLHSTWQGKLKIPFTADSTALVLSGLITEGNGSAWESWIGMGSPVNATATQLDLLRKHAEPAYNFTTLQAKKGEIAFDFELKPGEVRYYEISARGQKVTTRFVNPADFEKWNQGMGELSK